MVMCAMSGENTIPQPIVEELTALRQRVAGLEQTEAGRRSLEGLLRIALEDVDLDGLLRRALALVLEAKWPETMGVGAVFLVDEARDELVLHAHNGIGADIVRRCQRVRFGECLCGCVALAGQPIHVGHVDERHVISHPAMAPHGHYCLPIAAGDRLLGVLNVYVAAGHPDDPRELDFLTAFASTLAGIIVRRRAEVRAETAQHELRQAQKMEAVGRLAGGVAHDFNNILTTILGRAGLLLDDLATHDPRRNTVREIVKAAESAAALTRRLLTFSRKQVLKPEVVDLNAIIGSIEGMLRRLIREDVEVVLRLSPELRPIKADRVQVEQVLMNLVVNARDAMAAGGCLTIATENLLVGAGDAAKYPSVEPGDHVLLSVADTGHGMTPDVKARVFEPFFTTKDPAKGTGLGLSTVYGIVKQSHGHIWVDSAPGSGTRMNVSFPSVSPSDADTTPA